MSPKKPPATDPAKVKVAAQTLETIHAQPATPAQVSETELKTAGQRKINLLWEVTQAIIALLSVGAGVFIMVAQALGDNVAERYVPRDVPQTLASMIFLVLGFYFARTNHTSTGGVGPRDTPNQHRGE